LTKSNQGIQFPGPNNKPPPLTQHITLTNILHYDSNASTIQMTLSTVCLNKNVSTLASCSFDKHRLILKKSLVNSISTLSKMISPFTFSSFHLLYLLLDNNNGNNVQHKTSSFQSHYPTQLALSQPPTVVRGNSLCFVSFLSLLFKSK